MRSLTVPFLLAVAILLLVAYCFWPERSVTDREPRLHPAAAPIARQTVEPAPAPELAPSAPASVDESIEQTVALLVEEPAEAAPLGAMTDELSAATERSAEEPAGSASVEMEDVAEPVDMAAILSIEQTSTADTSLRNADYPRTFIRTIHVDLTSPNHWVRLTWAGPEAGRQERGPFRSSPGRGLGYNNCDDPAESNRDGSQCTPKGTMRVQGFSDVLPSYSYCRFVTWFHLPRAIAFHSHPQVPNYPASNGCVRLNQYAAQLIHNNSKIGETEVIVDGTWTFGR